MFINDNIKSISQNFIHELLMHAQRDNRALIFPLIYEMKKRFLFYIFKNNKITTSSSVDRKNYTGIGKYITNVTAGSLSCFMIKKSLFERYNCFDSTYINDCMLIDLSLNLLNNNYLHIFTPYAQIKLNKSLIIWKNFNKKDLQNLQAKYDLSIDKFYPQPY